MYCDLIFKEFGFTCRPIILDKKQKAVTNLWKILKEKRKKLPLIEPIYIILLTGGEKRIPIKPREFDFSDQDEYHEYFTDDELIRRLIATERDGEISETNEEEEETIETIKRKIEYQKESFYRSPYEEKRIEELKRKLKIINELRQIKQKGEQDTIEGKIKRLEARYDALGFIGEKPNKWTILPLSSIVEKSQTPKVPAEEGMHKIRSPRALFDTYHEYYDVPDIRYDISELWEEYIKSSKGIIKKPPYAKDYHIESNLFEMIDENFLPFSFSLEANIDLSKIAGLPLNDKTMDEIMKLDVDGR